MKRNLWKLATLLYYRLFFVLCMLIIFLSFAAKKILDSSDNNSDYDGEDANCMYQNQILKPRLLGVLYALCCMLLLCFAVVVQFNTTHVCDTASTQKPFMNFILAISDACLFFSDTKISTSTQEIYSDVKESKTITVKIEKFSSRKRA